MSGKPGRVAGYPKGIDRLYGLLLKMVATRLLTGGNAAFAGLATSENLPNLVV